MYTVKQKDPPLYSTAVLADFHNSFTASSAIKLQQNPCHSFHRVLRRNCTILWNSKHQKIAKPWRTVNRITRVSSLRSQNLTIAIMWTLLSQIMLKCAILWRDYRPRRTETFAPLMNSVYKRWRFVSSHRSDTASFILSMHLMNFRLIQPLMHFLPNFIVNWVQNWMFGPQVWRRELGCSRKFRVGGVCCFAGRYTERARDLTRD